MSTVERVVRFPVNALEYTNIVLTTDDAVVGATPKEVVWTHRETTLYRYRSSDRRYRIPILLVFALINRPDIFDLRPGSSLVEYLIEEGFDVFLVDWGYPDEEDAEMGLDEFVCDELDWAVRETLRASDADAVTLMGWCIGATLCAMYCALDRGSERPPVRNLVELTMPIDGRASTYAKWVGDADFDVEQVAELYGSLPGGAIDFANKMLKPVTNFWTTYRRLWDQVQEGTVRREAYQPMAKWVADNPPFPGRAWAQWIELMYRDAGLLRGRVRLRDRRVDLRRIDQSVLVITAGADHIAPRPGTMPFFDLISSQDVEHFARPGGHIGLVAGSAARKELWPSIAEWLAERSDPKVEQTEGGEGYEH
ncbi:MAG: alpha/beta fold hydrolase [Solirubrobacterales bacterium]|nr:alpha/beta fold hydrolase [Solirubrobacterales bacterium]